MFSPIYSLIQQMLSSRYTRCTLFHLQPKTNRNASRHRTNVETKMNVNCMRIKMELSLLKFRACRCVYHQKQLNNIVLALDSQDNTHNLTKIQTRFGPLFLIHRTLVGPRRMCVCVCECDCALNMKRFNTIFTLTRKTNNKYIQQPPILVEQR